MKHFGKTVLFLVFSSIFLSVSAQDLMDLFGDEEEQTTDYAYATFKTTRVVNSQSIENPAPGVLLFIISHHFGKVNDGAYNLFGLDQATMRIGFEYSINEWLCLGIGRSTFQKTVDGFAKVKLLRQSIGLRNMPVSVSLFSSTSLNGLRWQDPERENYFSSRMAYTHQLMIARKFGSNFSLQLMPVLVHKNLVPTENDSNDIFALGAGARVKITNRITFNSEYYYVFPNQRDDEIYRNTLSLGFDIETGGHVFQLHFTNSQPMFERGFITETRGNWLDGDIYFGFNITRVFTIKKPEEFRD
jgi:opacity protein-like surface antigen